MGKGTSLEDRINKQYYEVLQIKDLIEYAKNDQAFYKREIYFILRDGNNYRFGIEGSHSIFEIPEKLYIDLDSPTEYTTGLTVSMAIKKYKQNKKKHSPKEKGKVQ